MKKKYDLILGVGNACSATQTIRAAGLQHLSFPFDWIIYHDGITAGASDLRLRADTLVDGFDGWLDAADLQRGGFAPKNGKDIYENRRTGVIFNHDFRQGVPFDREFPVVRDRYARREGRLYRCLETSRSVLLVRVDRPEQKRPTSIDDCRYAQQRLAKRFPRAQFDLILFAMEKGRPLECRRTDDLGGGLARIAFDYGVYATDKNAELPYFKVLGSLMEPLYAVRDYRTRAERQAKRQRDLQRKFARYGATNRWQYFLAKLFQRKR